MSAMSSASFCVGYFFAGVLLLQGMRRSEMMPQQECALAYLVPMMIWPIVLIAVAVWMLALLCRWLVEGARE
jgi:hypothetical protein